MLVTARVANEPSVAVAMEDGATVGEWAQAGLCQERPAWPHCGRGLGPIKSRAIPRPECLRESLAGRGGVGLTDLRVYQDHTEVFDVGAPLVPGSTYRLVPRLRGGMMIKVCRLPRMHWNVPAWHVAIVAVQQSRRWLTALPAARHR